MRFQKLPRLKPSHSQFLRFVNVFYGRYNKSPKISDATHWLRISYRRALWVARKLERLGYLEVMKNDAGSIIGLFPLWKE